MIHARPIAFTILPVPIKHFRFMNASNPIKLSTTSTPLFKFLD